MARIILNKINISKKLNSSLSSKRFVGLARNAANTRFIFAKSAVIEDFENSEVTQEILAGPEATSKFLSFGNIVSFVGISNPEELIAQIRNKLELGIKMNITPNIITRKNGITFEFKVKSPALQEIYDVAPSEFSNKSVIQQVQDGMSNFMYFLYSQSGRFAQWSRSGTGIQSQYKSKTGKSGKVLGIPWINEIISNFRARFSSK